MPPTGRRRAMIPDDFICKSCYVGIYTVTHSKGGRIGFGI
jgi:hypothetical protein